MYRSGLFIGLFTAVLVASGCSRTGISKTEMDKDVSVAVLDTESVITPEVEMIEEELTAIVPDSTYIEEEEILAQILQLYEESIMAIDDEDFGRAEAKIDSASMHAAKIYLSEIEDEYLSQRFRMALSDLFMAYGKILSRVEEIIEDDPSTWLEELAEFDNEDFKSAKWSDEELRIIVERIALRSDIPIEFNREVRNAIYFFQTRRRNEMSTWLARSGRFLPMMKEVLEDEGLPLDLVYLSMIESGFSPRAYSKAAAVGLWQFIESTGRMYGLRRTQWIDERMDPLKSTRAGARHLRDLNNHFNCWNLAMAAYNCGQGRVQRTLNQHKTDYWNLPLPRETRGYVPLFMAAVVISKAPELFGFEGIEQQEPLAYETVEVHPYTSVATVAKSTGTSVDAIRALNPELRTLHAPPGNEKYMVKIPVGTTEKFLATYPDMPIEKYVPPQVGVYYVRRGDTLSGIASRFGVPLSRLMSENNIRNAHRISIGQRLTIPGTTTQRIASTVSIPAGTTINYTVRRNDTLGAIARRHGTTVAAIQRVNNMGNSTRIIAGHTITIPSIQPAAAAAPAVDTNRQVIRYVIKKNDTLYEIARQHGVSARDLQNWNGITNHLRIMPGQEIIIYKTGS